LRNIGIYNSKCLPVPKLHTDEIFEIIFAFHFTKKLGIAFSNVQWIIFHIPKIKQLISVLAYITALVSLKFVHLIYILVNGLLIYAIDKLHQNGGVNVC
jgi:hypothetical protein